MKFWPFRREVRSAPTIEDPRVPVSSENFLAFFGQGGREAPRVTLDAALSVPAVQAAVGFLSRTLANLPLKVFKVAKGGGAEPLPGTLQRVLNEAPNEEWSSFLWRSYFWQQVFTHGRGLSYIERAASGAPQAIWPMDACRAQVRRENGRKLYVLDGKVYAAADIIDVPFMLKDDQLQARSPLVMGGKAISLAIAMGDYASNFFAGDGIPPLALTGALPTGPDGFRRAVDDIKRAMEVAKDGRRGYFPIPPGYKLEPVGFDPAKGQMVEARLFQIQEIARVYQLPPAFLQDLSKGTFSNTEQQDLQVTKHCIAQWSKALEDELNLKLFGSTRNSRYAEHSMDGLLRGDLAARMTALSQAINSALLMPDEARALDNRPAAEGGNRLYIQGATVPLAQSGGQAPATPNPPPADPAPASNGAAA